MNETYKQTMKGLMKIVSLHRKLIEKNIKSTGVYRAQHQILMMLSRDTGISQKEIAMRQDCSTAAVAVSLKKLEQGGYIRRGVNEEDNRFNQVVITEQGNQVVKDSIDIFRKIDQTIFEGISPEELDQFNQTIAKIRKNIKDTYHEE